MYQRVPGRQCWICLADGPGLISPCECSGSMQWVHRACLDRWRVSARNPMNFTHCRHCGFQFRLVLLGPERQERESDLKLRRRRFVGRVMGECVLGNLVVQVVVMLLALIIRLLDPHEFIVTLFHFDPLEDASPLGGERDVWHALRTHKSEYYLAAVLVALALLGGCVVVSGCLQAVCDRSCAECLRDPCTTYTSFWACEDCSYFCRDCCAEGCHEQCAQCGRLDKDFCPGNCAPSMAGGGDDCGGLVLVVCALVAVLFVFVGLFAVLMAAVVWLYRLGERYLQVHELRELAGEYVVQDLAEGTEVPEELLETAPEQHRVAASAEAAGGTEEALQQELERELQAIYGLGDVRRHASRQRRREDRSSSSEASEES